MSEREFASRRPDPDVVTQWIFHRSPELVVYDESGRQVRRISLANYDYEQLHTLFRSNFRHVSQITTAERLALANRTQAWERAQADAITRAKAQQQQQMRSHARSPYLTSIYKRQPRHYSRSAHAR